MKHENFHLSREVKDLETKLAASLRALEQLKDALELSLGSNLGLAQKIEIFLSKIKKGNVGDTSLDLSACSDVVFTCDGHKYPRISEDEDCFEDTVSPNDKVFTFDGHRHNYEGRVKDVRPDVIGKTFASAHSTGDTRFRKSHE